LHVLLSALFHSALFIPIPSLFLFPSYSLCFTRLCCHFLVLLSSILFSFYVYSSKEKLQNVLFMSCHKILHFPNTCADSWLRNSIGELKWMMAGGF
jgi:hypothetical protein